MKPDFQKLMQIAAMTETIPGYRFSMERYGRLGDCNSSGCMLGWAAHRGILQGVDGAMGELGISESEWKFLFGTGECLRSLLRKWKRPVIAIARQQQREIERPAAATARVRKFIYYKLRKAELLADDNSRYLGDVGVAAEVERQIMTTAIGVSG